MFIIHHDRVYSHLESRFALVPLPLVSLPLVPLPLTQQVLIHLADCKGLPADLLILDH
jgi:hypothetical protein